MDEELGVAFAKALAAKDPDALRRVLAPTVDFRAMTPSKFWESNSVDEVVDDIIFGAWFEPSDRVDALEAVETTTISDRCRVGYRFRVTNPDGAYLVDQQAYFAAEGDRITWLRVMCAGYRPV
jgi:hypothetical protein